MSTRRCVVIGDVIGSREVEDRQSLRARLEEGIARVNDELAGRLVAPFETLKGVDEVGGVLADLGGTYRAVRVLSEAAHPTGMRIAIVRGAVDIGDRTASVSEMDGPAFHDADDALEHLRDRDRHVALTVDRGPERWLVDLAASQMELLSMWKQEWTARQGEVVRAYREAGKMAAAAERLDVSVQSVSKTLRRARAEAVFEVESNLEAAMEQLAEVER